MPNKPRDFANDLAAVLRVLAAPDRRILTPSDVQKMLNPRTQTAKKPQRKPRPVPTVCP